MFSDFQTDLFIDFFNGSQLMIPNIHPDSEPKIYNGTITCEDLDGKKIHYVPAQNVRNFYTVCVPLHD